MKANENKKNVCPKPVVIPEGKFCSNCADRCRYYYPSDRDSNGRAYCGYYESYYYPRERNGCLSYERG